jgi:DNA modification methylase
MYDEPSAPAVPLTARGGDEHADALAPVYGDDQVALYRANCRTVLAQLEPGSVDAVVTDPPYEIRVHDQDWDATGIAFDPDVWRACLRVLKPGGHLLAFGHPRTYHRLAGAIETAGWRVRDSIHWIYGQGQPHGSAIGPALARRRDDRAEILTVTRALAAARDAAGWTNRALDEVFDLHGMANHWTTQGVAAAVPTVAQWARLRTLLTVDPAVDQLVANLNARKRTRPDPQPQPQPSLGTMADDPASMWEGWHTTLKPAHEPIVLARKTTGFHTTAATMATYGTGALNIDPCRIPRPGDGAALGRWPTNLLFSHAPMCEQSGCVAGCPVRELGAAAVFFPVFRYLPKAKADQRPRATNGAGHATVKPRALMRWLVRLVTAPGALVLDPFAGTATTLQAALDEGRRAIGVENDPAHIELAIARLSEPQQLALT